MSESRRNSPPEPDRDKALELMFSIALPPERPAFAERLRNLQEARETVLDDDELSQLRTEVLGELVSPQTFPTLLAVTLGILIVGTLGIAAIGWYDGQLGLVLSGLIPLVGALFWARRIYRHGRSKNDLTLPQRLAIVDGLLSADLITPEEAHDLRARIEETQLAPPPSIG